MYAKIFAQIFDSSIAENYRHRHVFEDLLKMADKTGVVDMTMEAVARRANAPLDEVRAAIEFLLSPDAKSRSKEQDGRRIIPVDSRRDWGWIIVNYTYYRGLYDEETRRQQWRDAKAKQRAKTGKKKRRGETSLERVGTAAHGAGDDAAYNDAVTASLPPACRQNSNEK
jgi:hypothetical protein